MVKKLLTTLLSGSMLLSGIKLPVLANGQEPEIEEMDDTVVEEIIDTIFPESSSVSIPSTAAQYNGNYYYLYSNVCETWEEAKSYCESLGGHLAIINNDKENTFLFDLMIEKGYKNVYFGLSDSEVEGVWKWVDGTSPKYTNWSEGEPNNERGVEHYAMFYYKSPDYQWNDGDFDPNRGSDPLAFFCEWEKDSLFSGSENTNLQKMYRLYNSNSGEHFYTTDKSEKEHLVSIGWDYEGLGWNAPKTSNTPVYRLYNEKASDHHYTTDKNEKDTLVRIGWKDEKIGWYSDDQKGVPLYRVYNPNTKKAGSHHYTTDSNERNTLISRGWNYEGVAWYGLK